MARQKKIQTEELISNINDFFHAHNKDCKKLKYTTIAAYLNNKGINIKEYDIRRNQEAVNHIKELSKINSMNSISSAVVFKTLDIDAFIKKNSTTQSLKKALTLRDNYYSDMCTSVNRMIQLYHELEQKYISLELKYEKEIHEYNHFKSDYDDILHENNKLKEENTLIKNLLKDNVYPEIANELLRETGLLQGGNSIISEDGKKNIIKAETSFVEVINKNDKLRSTNSVIQGLFDKI